MASKSVTYLSYKELYEMLLEAQQHLEFCGYGDTYERECARDDKLPERISKALQEAEEILGEENE